MCLQCHRQIRATQCPNNSNFRHQQQPAGSADNSASCVWRSFKLTWWRKGQLTSGPERWRYLQIQNSIRFSHVFDQQKNEIHVLIRWTPLLFYFTLWPRTHFVRFLRCCHSLMLRVYVKRCFYDAISVSDTASETPTHKQKSPSNHIVKLLWASAIGSF